VVNSHVVLGKKLSGGKKCVRQCAFVIQEPVLLSPKFGAKFSHIFKANDEHALDFARHLSCLFSISVSLEILCKAPKHFFNHCHGLRCTFSEICTKFDREIASGHIHDSK
jgi:hypothetical protein